MISSLQKTNHALKSMLVSQLVQIQVEELLCCIKSNRKDNNNKTPKKYLILHIYFNSVPAKKPNEESQKKGT